MTDDLERYREEHRAEVIGPLLAELLERVVRATAHRYPPAIYTDARTWSREALEDLLSDWVEVRLLRRGDLARMLATARDAGRLRGALTTSLSQFLINRRAGGSAWRLYTRTKGMLRADDAFACEGNSRSQDAAWTLADEPASAPSTLQTDQLLRIAWERDDDALEVVRYGPHSLKSSPILREPKLHELLVHLFRGAGGTLSLRRIFDVMRLRFNLLDPEIISLDDAGELPADTGPPKIELEAAALSTVRRLGQAQLAALRAFEEADRDFAVAARHLGSQEADVADAVSEVTELIAEHAETPDEARQLYLLVIESLFS